MLTPKPPRDGFIDALRAIALVRVVIWHATGEPLVSWVITTMPLMFFVAGSLLFGSLDRRPARIVLQRRLKRLLIPFWFFGAVVLSVCAVVDLRTGTAATALSLDKLWAWVLPLVNPTASQWEAGWASSPLWYLRAYLWILLISPALVWAWRRMPAALLGASVAIAVGAQLIADATDAGPGASIWILGDLGIYTVFVLLGFAHHQGRFDNLSRRDIIEWLGVAVVATAVAWRFTASADGVINHSYPALLTYGIVWLCAALLVRPILAATPQLPVIGPVLYWMTRRAMSIYLWHSPAIVGAYWLLARAGFNPSPLPVLGLTAMLVVIASTATGWIEDVAGGRSPELVPLPDLVQLPRLRISLPGRQILAGTGTAVTVTLLAASVLAQPNAEASRPTTSVDSGLALPPAPSGRPDPSAASAAHQDAPAIPQGGDLTALADRWRALHNVDGVRIGITGPDLQQLLVSGTDTEGEPLRRDDIVPVTSITKTMTAAVALQLVDEGLLQLDEPIPTLVEVPELQNLGPITLRQLLNHSSGLVPYQQADGYRPTAALSPVEAVRLAARMPLEWAPGTSGGYSNSGYLAIGVLIEQVTGQTFEAVLAERILVPNELVSTQLDLGPTQGWVGHAAGGVQSNAADLTRWGDLLYRSGSVASPAALQQMTSVDGALMAGLGAFPVCPCPDNGDGTVDYVSIGHNGGSVALHYAPASDIVVVVTFTESFWTEELTQQDVYEFLALIRAAVSP